jgi:RNA polymerase sigma-70 factor, ECF subfamily
MNAGDTRIVTEASGTALPRGPFAKGRLRRSCIGVQRARDVSHEGAAIKVVPRFEEFFEQEHSRLFAALTAVTGDRQEAEEIMQDAFLKMWERWERLAHIEDLRGYLYRTAMNTFRSRYRRTKLALRKTTGAFEPEDAYAAVDARQTLMQALRTLTPHQRAAIVLTSLLGFSSEEAGEMLGTSAASVRTLSTRARAQIRDIAEVEE